MLTKTLATVVAPYRRKPAIAYILLLCMVFGAGATAAPDMAGYDEPVSPLPDDIEYDSARAELGARLFNDVRLSSNDQIACASCHQLVQGGDDGLRVSITITGEDDEINTPTVFNTGLLNKLTWRGAFKTLEAQADDVIKNPRHLNITWEKLLPKLQAIAAYANSFAELYPEGLNRESVLNALAEYERSLITPNAAFDRWLRGDADAISNEAQQGYLTFKLYGCVSCHQGMMIGGNVYQKIGIFGNFFAAGTVLNQADLGRYAVTGKAEDKHVFRVPSLRNVAVTAPYFHNGAAKNLHQAVKAMAEHQLGVTLSELEINNIVAFLKTLTGTWQGVPLQSP